MFKSNTKNLSAATFIGILGIIIVYNVLTMVLIKYGLFCDEIDNIIGGKVIANGGILYKDYVTQHPPVMYYICAMLTKLGCITIPQYRIAFYIIMSAIMSFVYFRYSRYFGRKTLVILPLMFIFATVFVDNAFMILSDQMEAVALLVLFLEYLVYERKKVLTISNCIVISLSIFLAIGTAVVAFYPVIVIFLGAVTFEIIWLKRDHKEEKCCRKIITFKYLRLIGFIIIPFILVLAVMTVQNSLREAYTQAYVMNVQDYAKYTGISSNIPETILSTFANYFSSAADVLMALVLKGPFVSGSHLTSIILNLQRLVLFLANFLFLGHMIKNKKYALGIFSLLFAVFCTVRGIVSFHSLAWYTISSFMLLFLLNVYIFNPLAKAAKNNFKLLAMPKNIVRIGLLMVVFALLASTYLYKYKIKTYDAALGNAKPNQIESAILKLTNKDEKIYINDIDKLYIYVYSGRNLATSNLMMLPWVSDRFEIITIRELEKNNPRVIIYDQNAKTGSYKTKDFAADLDTYIRKNYSQIGYNGDNAKIWVRNDYLAQAKLKMCL